MRTLVVAQDFPWPVSLGSHLRLQEVVRATAAVGEVDLFAFVPARRTEPCAVPDGVSVSRVATATNPRPHASWARRLRWLSSPGVPVDVVEARDPEIRHRFERWVAGPYDFVWFSKAATYERLSRPRLGPTVVDLDDLEDEKILGRLRAARSESASAAGGLRRVLSDAQARLDARRWHRLQDSVAASADRVVLCSELDARRLGSPNVIVVPNGYRAPEAPTGRPDPGRPPTISFPANFCYGPNADAARWLVGDILPELEARLPGLSLRLVGEPDSWLTTLHRPEVTVTGRVAVIEPELARADVVAVPIRFGSGTRIKIIEAFAHRIPVVSTTVGAEGLDVAHDEHLLLADDPATFATACATLVNDLPRRQRLVAAAHELFLARYQWSAAGTRIAALAEELAGPGQPRRAPSSSS
jgi:glycosyltransferase involved in cell wall biosynthesis